MAQGIVGYGVYIPRYRIKREDIARAWGGRARGENSVAFSNEDALTMAAEAALNAVEQAGLDPGAIDAFYLATDSSPYMEHSVVRAIGDVLRLKPELEIADFTTSPRAGAAALKSCQDALKAGSISYGLVVAADSRPVSPGSDEELAGGAAAAAFLLGKQGAIAEIEASYTYSSYFIDSWRGAGQASVRSHEPRFTREYGYTAHIVQAVQGLLRRLERKVEDFSYVVLQQHPDERVVRGAARALGISPQQLEKGSLGAVVGDTGCASAPLGLAAVLEQAAPGEKILTVFYGSGIADALSIVVTEAAKKVSPPVPSLQQYLSSKEYIDYLSFARMRGLLEKAEAAAKMWVPPVSPQWWRDGSAIRRLVGARCTRCGYVNFPPTLRRICIRCGSQEFTEFQRSRRGKIHTFCVNIYNPPGVESPLPVIIADMEDGTRYKTLGTEMKLEEIKIDLPVELVWRRIGEEEGVGAYAYVFRPPRQVG